MARHAACGYDGPHRGPHPVIVVIGDLRALIAAGDMESPCLREESCPGERGPLEREQNAEDDGWRQWWTGAGTWTEDQ